MTGKQNINHELVCLCAMYVQVILVKVVVRVEEAGRW